ncbi:Uma2 family endonuclease [soil metagenome]
MSAVPKPFITPEEYLRLERIAKCKSEYFNGEVFAMAGASAAHVRINNNLVGELHVQFRDGPCYSGSSDLRVKIEATGLYTYPDTTVLCEDMLLDEGTPDVLLNPKVIFEILSPTTERYDRGTKFEHYRTIKTLQEYILVSQVKPYIEQFVRQDDVRWVMTPYSGLDAILELASVSAKVELKRLYQGVTFPALTLFDELEEMND